MKYLTTMCLVLLTLYAVPAHAQKPTASRSSLFPNVPENINCTEAQLDRIFNYLQGQNVSLAFANNFTLSGSVTSNLVKYSNLQTIVIKLPAFSNTLFSLSKQTDNNQITFVGRVFNPAYGDALELKRNENGDYQLIKIDAKNILVDCIQ